MAQNTSVFWYFFMEKNYECIFCRSFGVHLSKVRSVTLDAWEPELLKVMTALGNSIINRIYEANVDDSVTRAVPSSVR